MYLYYKWKKDRLGLLCGFDIPLNVADKGLGIAHIGSIVISPFAKIGSNSRIHSCVNIGAKLGSDKAPVIGNNVFIGPGAKLFGDIVIANDVVIGAGSVVNKSFTQENISIAGVPAKKIGDNGRRTIQACKNKVDDFESKFK